jgi:predicted permease
MRRPLLRLLNTLRHGRAEDELAREMEAHLGVLEDAFRAQGMDPGSARLAARRAMHGVESTKDAHRDARAFVWLEDFARDIRHAFRMMRRDKAWTAVVVLCLALGIGANTAIFGAVNGLLVAKLPVKDPDSLVRLRHTLPNDMATMSDDYGYSADVGGRDVRATFSFPMFRELQDANRAMTSLAAAAPLGQVNIAVDGAAEVASGFMVSGNYFATLGVSARLGRTLQPSDDTASAAPVAVVTDAYWRSRFGADPQIVGRDIHVNNVPATIVGVLPPGYAGIQRPTGGAPDLTLPLALFERISPDPDERLEMPTRWWLELIGRLLPDATPQQVQGNLAGVFQTAARSGRDEYLAGLTDEQRALEADRSREDVPDLIVDSASRGVYDAPENDTRIVAILGGAVGLVLLLVCANVANLLLSRSTTRQREMSVRQSLGASGGRLARQLLTESLLLAALGGALGLLAGYWSRFLLPAQTGRTFTFDGGLVVFIAALTALAGVAFGIAPALRAARSLDAELRTGGRTVTRSRARLGRGLLVFQVTVSLLLLIGAGLFLRTVDNLRKVDVGFDPDNVVIFRVNPGLTGYERQNVAALYDRIAARLSTVPGVRAVGASHMRLLSGAENTTTIYSGSAKHGEIFRLVVTPSFFDTLGIPLMAGRSLTDRDTATSPKIAVVNQSFAALDVFGGISPIGRRFGHSPEDSTAIEVVGIVANVKYSEVRDDAPPTMFVPFSQAAQPSASFEVRTAVDPLLVVNGLRAAMREIDPNLPLTDITTQVNLIEGRFTRERVLAQLYSLFGALAAIVAAIGLFGVMSYGVARRTNEIGIRMTLGARPARVLAQVLGEALTLAAVGIAVGLLVAMGAGRLIDSQLYGLAPTDPVTAAGAAALMIAAAAIAAYVPARRASRVDPMVALRCE